MYKRSYTFLNNKSIIYNLQFGFRQQYSTSHALINITEIIRKDDGNIIYQYHQLSNRSQYVSINGYDSGLAAINCCVTHGSVLGSLQFLLHINNLKQAIKY